LDAEVNDFDQELELELHRVLDPIVAAAVPPVRVRAQTRPVAKLLGGAGAAFAAKAVTGIAIAAFAAGAAGAATEAMITHSLNPADWGQQVKQQLHISTATPTSSAQHHGGQSSPPTGGVTGQPPSSANPVLPGVTPLPTLTPLPKTTPLPTVTPLPTPVLPTAKPTCVPLIGGVC
jgi:hypothetical protein